MVAFNGHLVELPPSRATRLGCAALEVDELLAASPAGRASREQKLVAGGRSSCPTSWFPRTPRAVYGRREPGQLPRANPSKKRVVVITTNPKFVCSCTRPVRVSSGAYFGTFEKKGWRGNEVELEGPRRRSLDLKVEFRGPAVPAPVVVPNMLRLGGQSPTLPFTSAGDRPSGVRRRRGGFCVLLVEAGVGSAGCGPASSVAPVHCRFGGPRSWAGRRRGAGGLGSAGKGSRR